VSSRSPAVGDTVEHTNSHRMGEVRQVRPWRDGTLELRVHVDALDVWWSSRHVRNLTAEQESNDSKETNMKMLEVTITIKLQVPDTDDKLGDCLAAMDAAKDLLAETPGHALLRTRQARFGGPLVSITRLRRMERGGIMDAGESSPPLAVDASVEE